MKVANGKEVTIQYTLSVDGRRFQAANARRPCRFVCGTAERLPIALEQALVGLEPGQHTQVTLPPEKAYGTTRRQRLEEVRPQTLPQEALRPGAELTMRDAEGNRRLTRIHEVHPDRVLISRHHPLAGRTLVYDVQILEVA